ncbi:hypothetical protein LP416_15080 [Polaromonas sp. P2-4]|nr:hypothetical protein LP416_15080 [Polaromonas sp. P2-4]
MRVDSFEMAYAPGKGTDHRRLQHAIAVANPVNAPLSGLRVEKAQGHADRVLALHDQVVHVAQAAQQQGAVLHRVKTFPFGAALQALAQTLVADQPASGDEVEIVAPIREVGHIFSLRHGCFF